LAIEGKTLAIQYAAISPYNSNVVNSLPASVQYSWGGSALKGDNIDGHPWGSYYGFIADGIYKTQDQVTQLSRSTRKRAWQDPLQRPFRPRRKNRMADRLTTTNQTWIGNGATPKIEYGLSLGFNYKTSTFSMFWQGCCRRKSL